MLIPSHPNVIEIIGLQLRLPMGVVLELAQQSLLKKIQTLFESDELISLKRLATWMLEISRGVQHLHKHDIVHRDLSCRNILIMKDGTCKVSDFGLSRPLSKSEHEWMMKKNHHWMQTEIWSRMIEKMNKISMLAPRSGSCSDSLDCTGDSTK